MKYEHIKIKIEKIIYWTLFYGLSIVYFSEPYSEAFNRLIAWLVIIFSVILIAKSKNNILLFIISFFIGYSNYSIAMGVYIINLRSNYLYPQIIDISVYGRGILILFLLEILMIALMPNLKRNSRSISELFINENNKNNIFVILLFLLGLFIVFYFYTPSINSSRGSSSPVYEYSIILIIIMFYFSGRDKKNLALIYLISIIYILQSFMSGNRIEAISCIIAVFLCTYKRKIKWYNLLIPIFVGLVAMNFIGNFRDTMNVTSSGIIMALDDLWKEKLVFNTCTYAYFPGLCMIKYSYSLSYYRSLYYLKQFIYTIFLGQSRAIDGDLIGVVRKYYFHNDGGLTLYFFYLWFGWGGTIIFAIILKFYYRTVEFFEILNREKSYYWCMIIYFAATVPRWYLYGPWPLFRGMLICMILFFAFLYLNKVIRYK